MPRPSPKLICHSGLAVLALFLGTTCLGAKPSPEAHPPSVIILPNLLNFMDGRYDFAYDFMTRPLHLGGMGETSPSIASRRALALEKAHPSLQELKNYAAIFEAAFFQALSPSKDGGLGYLYENDAYYWAKYMADTLHEPAQFDALVEKYRYALSFALKPIQEGGLGYDPDFKTRDWALLHAQSFETLEELENFIHKYREAFEYFQSPEHQYSPLSPPELRDRALANLNNVDHFKQADLKNPPRFARVKCLKSQLKTLLHF
jgi:hypothetical protein